MTQGPEVIPFTHIVSAIYSIRGLKVMLDRDLAALYGVETRALNQAVKRNRDRFPLDFMFDLTRDEIRNISQTVICSVTLKHAPRAYAFTEQGVAMLSGVLNSPRAVEVNIAIMRAFVRLREFLLSQTKLAKRLRQLEQEVASHGKAIGTLFDAMQQMTSERPAAIGFQYMDGGDGESGAGKTIRERRAQYRCARKTKRAGKA